MFYDLEGKGGEGGGEGGVGGEEGEDEVTSKVFVVFSAVFDENEGPILEWYRFLLFFSLFSLLSPSLHLSSTIRLQLLLLFMHDMFYGGVIRRSSRKASMESRSVLWQADCTNRTNPTSCTPRLPSPLSLSPPLHFRRHHQLALLVGISSGRTRMVSRAIGAPLFQERPARR